MSTYLCIILFLANIAIIWTEIDLIIPKKNLRPATSSENSQNRSLRSDNTSGVIGVSFSTNENKWIAQVRLNGKKVFYKKYILKEDAIRARLLAEKKYFGEFASQKHLYQQYKIN